MKKTVVRSCLLHVVGDKEFLQITIGTKVTMYLIEPLEVHQEMARCGFRLSRSNKANSKRCDIVQNWHGFNSCTCADARFRQRECKHIKALQAIGKLPKTMADVLLPDLTEE